MHTPTLILKNKVERMHQENLLDESFNIQTSKPNSVHLHTSITPLTLYNYIYIYLILYIYI